MSFEIQQDVLKEVITLCFSPIELKEPFDNWANASKGKNY